MKEFVASEDGKLIKSIEKAFPTLNYNSINRALRSKDIKVNGKRVNHDDIVYAGDRIQVYIDFDRLEQNIKILYQDSNVAIINKPMGIEVKSDDDNDLVHRLYKQTGQMWIPCHRLDVNTEGVMIFAKNTIAEDIIESAFKDHRVKKIYNAWVVGQMPKDEDTLVAYLRKDEKNARVYIYDDKRPGTDQIITKYRVEKKLPTTSLLSVEIVTGKTHQIRAHLSHIGHPIIGDDKYGNRAINKQMNLKKQCLTSVMISCDFVDTKLSYLNNKPFGTTPSWLKYIDRDRINTNCNLE